MPDFGYLLSEDDVAVLRSLLEREQGAVRNTENRGHEFDDPPPSPEVYVCRAPDTPIGSISAAIGADLVRHWRPGHGTCDIYRITLQDLDNLPLLEPIWLDQVVYNLGLAPILPRSWLIATQDSFGCWVATTTLVDPSGDDPGTGTGTGTGTSKFAYYEYKTDCVSGRNVRHRRLVTVTDPLLRSHVGTWEFDSYQGSCDEPGTGTSSGTASFSYHEYKTDCIDGLNWRYKRLVTVGLPLEGSSLGPWLFDSFQGNCDFPGTGTGHPCDSIQLYEEQIRCQNGVLNVYQRTTSLYIGRDGCLAKEAGAWAYNRNEGCCDCDVGPTGTGTSLYTGTSTGTTAHHILPCCPSLSLPNRIHATFTLFPFQPPGCAGLDGLTTALDWDGGGWTGTYSVCGVSGTLRLTCVLSTWSLSNSGTCVWFSQSAPTTVCSPGDIVSFTVVTDPSCCGNCSMTVTVTL